LSVWRRPLALAGILLLTACSHNASLPPFTASGYALPAIFAGRGVPVTPRAEGGEKMDFIARIFTPDILAAFSPWRHGDTSTSEYRWQGDQLTLIELNVYGTSSPESLRQIRIAPWLSA
jgi:hypothetical protein